MYESWFHFSDRPFGAAPQPKSYYPAAGIDLALESTANCVQRSAGPALVVGETGTGKTLFSLLLRQRFREAIPVALLKGTSSRTNRALLQNALYAFGLPYSETDEGQMRLTLTEFLGYQATGGASCLVIVDEADCLEVTSLEELAGLSNLTGDQGWCLNLVLIGSVRLEESLGLPQLESLNQRIAARNYLTRWTRAETTGYITAELQRVAGAVSDAVAHEAMEQVHRVTDGVPRLVNQLCDHTLVLAATAQVSQITAEMVNEAWADLQQLPPRQAAVVDNADPVMAFSTKGLPDRTSEFDGEIEFGTLEEDGIKMPAAVAPAWQSLPADSADLSLGGDSHVMDHSMSAVPHASDEAESLEQQVNRMQEQVEQINSELAQELEGTEEFFPTNILSSSRGSFEVDPTDIFAGPIGWAMDASEADGVTQSAGDSDPAEPSIATDVNELCDVVERGRETEPADAVNPLDSSEPCHDDAQQPRVTSASPFGSQTVGDASRPSSFPTIPLLEAVEATPLATNPFLEEFADEEVVYLRSPILSPDAMCLGQAVFTEEGQSLRQMIHDIQRESRQTEGTNQPQGVANRIAPDGQPWVVAAGQPVSADDEDWVPYGAAATSAGGGTARIGETDVPYSNSNSIVTHSSVTTLGSEAAISPTSANATRGITEARDRSAPSRDRIPPGNAPGSNGAIRDDSRIRPAGTNARRFSRLFSRLMDK